jgi:predicted metal-dependent hydrolase
MQLGLPFESQPEPSQAPVEPPAPRRPGLELYFVRHRRARRYVLRVDLDGRVRVTLPPGGSRREAAAFAERHVDWIRQQQATSRQPAIAINELRRLRALARLVLPARLMELASQHGVAVTRVSIRNQRSRWGSCGRDGHVSLNWRLVRMPDWVRDYVLIHELMHLRRMDHSPKYWKFVAAACPDYEAARRWLREHGPSLR